LRRDEHAQAFDCKPEDSRGAQAPGRAGSAFV
jgi:hypothetical protein